MRTRTLSKTISLCLLSLVISCGGGGESAGSSGTSAVTTKIVSGVASNGAAMVGTVYLQDAKGEERNTVIGNEGSFAITVNDLTAPFLLKAVSTDHATACYSFAAADGTAHINPFTHMAVVGAAGTADLETFYKKTYMNQHATIMSGFNDQVASLKNKLGQLFTNFNVVNTNFLSGNIQIGKGLDAVFDSITLDVNPTANTTLIMYASDPSKPFITMTRSGNQMTSISNVENMPGDNTNTKPAAHAGTTQSVVAGTVVTLDGSGSSDANGDLLTYFWAFTSRPSGSGATLSGTTDVKPTFTADIAGTYILSLVVNDGKASSAPATVNITSTTNTGSITVKW